MELNVRKIRNEMDMTQSDFARRIGVSEKTIWNWEHGYVSVPKDKVEEIRQIYESYQHDIKVAPIRRIPKEETKAEPNVRKIRKAMDLTQAEFAERLGVSESTIYNWERGGNVPEEKALYMRYLLNQYGMDSIWNKLDSDEKEEEENMIPLLPVSAIGGSCNDDDAGVMMRDCESVLSPIKNAQMAIRVSGDSMYPRYPNGSMVFVREVDSSIFVEWGSYYVVNTTNGTIIKRVFKGEDNTIECRSVNPDYQPFFVPMSEVRKMYKILGALHLE